MLPGGPSSSAIRRPAAGHALLWRRCQLADARVPAGKGEPPPLSRAVRNLAQLGMPLCQDRQLASLSPCPQAQAQQELDARLALLQGRLHQAAEQQRAGSHACASTAVRGVLPMHLDGGWSPQRQIAPAFCAAQHSAQCAAAWTPGQLHVQPPQPGHRPEAQCLTQQRADLQTPQPAVPGGASEPPGRGAWWPVVAGPCQQQAPSTERAAALRAGKLCLPPRLWSPADMREAGAAGVEGPPQLECGSSTSSDGAVTKPRRFPARDLSLTQLGKGKAQLLRASISVSARAGPLLSHPVRQPPSPAAS